MSLRLLDAGNDLELATAAGASFDVDTKDSLEPTRPVHRHMARGGADPCGAPLPRYAGVTGDFYTDDAVFDADGAVPQGMLDTWQRRLNYDTTKHP